MVGGLSAQENQRIESILGKVLRRVLNLPISTPYWGMLVETGIWLTQWLIKYKRMLLYHELKYTEKERLAKKMMEEQEKYKMNG